MNLRERGIREHRYAHLNGIKIHNQWRKIMRMAKVRLCCALFEAASFMFMFSTHHQRLQSISNGQLVYSKRDLLSVC